MSNNNFSEKIKNFFSKFKKLTNNDLKKVTGASNEPEEFDWKTRGYVTPAKDQSQNDDWKFEAITDKDIKDIFKR